MKNYIKSIVCFALVAMMLLSAVACGGTTPEVTTEKPTENTTEKPTEKITENTTEEPSEITTEVTTEEKTEATETKAPETEETETETKEIETETEEPAPVVDENALRFDEEGNFQIAIFSDLRLSKNVDATVIANMVKLIDEINPSLVLFGGDIHDGSIKTESDLRVVLDAINAPLEERGIKWCHTFGVDSEGKGGSKTGFTRAEQYEVYKTYEYCITPETAEGIYGDSNYAISIYPAESDKVGFNLWCLDTNGYLNDYEQGMEDGVLLDKVISGGTKLDTVHFSQILWYWNKSVEFEEANGYKVPGMMYMQVPVYQLYYLYRNMAATGMTGSMANKPSASERDSGIVWTCFERGDIKGIFCGYDASNDYAGKYLDMIMAGCASIGTAADENNAGARVVTITENGKNVSTKMAYVIERVEIAEGEIDPLNPDLVALDVSEYWAKNNASSGIEILTLNGSAATYIDVDREIGKTVAIFEGGAKASAYVFAADTIEPKLIDGFAYELYFKATGTSKATKYMSVLDYCQGGGFGLNLYTTSDPTKLEVKAELNAGGTYLAPKATINIDEWVHCVFTFDGTNLCLYINGKLVDTVTTNQAMKMPNFGTGMKMMCIGSGAGVDAVSQDGYTGLLAICNLFSQSLTAEQVAEMYAKNTAK